MIYHSKIKQMRTQEIKGLIKSHHNMIYRLEKMLKETPKQINEERFPSELIVQEVNNKFMVDITKITRKKKVMYARHAAVYLLKTHTNLIWQDIAVSVGNTHHTSVIHSYKAAKNIMETDDEYLQTINEIKERLVDLK